MVIDDEIKIFIRFLKENKSYSQYIHYLSNKQYAWHRENKLNAVQIRNLYGLDELVNRAFSWDTTYEGFDYWDDMNNKWHSFIRKNNLWYER